MYAASVDLVKPNIFYSISKIIILFYRNNSVNFSRWRNQKRVLHQEAAVVAVQEASAVEGKRVVLVVKQEQRPEKTFSEQNLIVHRNLVKYVILGDYL